VLDIAVEGILAGRLAGIREAVPYVTEVGDGDADDTDVRIQIRDGDGENR
jgi:hypothetical protein